MPSTPGNRWKPSVGCVNTDEQVLFYNTCAVCIIQIAFGSEVADCYQLHTQPLPLPFQ